jgi:hypothetical protein
MSYIPLVLRPLITSPQLGRKTLEFNILPGRSDIIHLLEQQFLLSQTVNEQFKVIQTVTKP